MINKPKPTFNYSADAGFTLLELIIAFTILALMAGMVYSGLQIALNSYETSQIRLEEQARKRVLIDHLKRQIGSLFPLRPTASFMAELQEEPEAPDLVTQMVMSQAPLFYGDSDSMTFITVAPLVLEENPGLTVVRYGLAEDEFGDRYFGSMETRFTGLEVFITMADLPSGKPLPLVRQIEELEFEYYGYDPGTQTYAWTNTWIGEEMSAVPQAVRISFDNEYLIVSVNASLFGGDIPMGVQGLLQQGRSLGMSRNPIVK